MVKIVYPKNKEHFIKLKAFCKTIISICKDLKISPIAYGSLAYFAYTKSNEMKVNDIDLLVGEDSFRKIIKALSKEKIKYRYSEKWHNLQVFKGRLKIELDSYEFWHINLKDSKSFDFGGLTIKIVSLKNLKNIYKWSSKHSKTKPHEYRKKFNLLMKL